MAGRNDKDKGVNVQVLLRCRPFNEEETKKQALQVICCNDLAREVTIRCKDGGKNAERIFTFDKVFGPTAQQKDLYDQAVIPIVNEVLEGFNCTIFAYGQTGTGKTYTMEGEGRKSKNGSNGELPADAGVIPRAVKQIFDTLESQNAEYSVKVTFLELYNEEITDLLAPEDVSKPASEDKQKKPLALMEDGKGGVLVRGLEEEIVTSADEIFTLLERGTAKRRTAETWLNKQSSRSHSLFTITIHIKEATPEGEELIKCGKLNLVDLAGSENISRSGAREGRVREAGEINKSLLTLGRVITALVEHLGHVPYRDSKLTRLLRDSLGGRTKTCIIATVSPSVQCLDETLSTLDYAHRAKNIKNKPEVNQKMMKSTLIKDLYAEIERLKAEIYAAREKSGVYIPKDRYYQEEAEKKAMSDKIEQVEVTLEETNRRFNDLREKFDAKQRLCEELTSNLETTQKTLEYTKKSLSSLKEDYRQAQYAVKEREYVMSRQNESENALTHQACLLRADLEKSIQDVAGLFAKIERKEKESAGNRALVQKFQTELSEHIGNLCIMVIESMSKQNEHLQSLQKQFTSWMDSRAKATEDVNSKVKSLKLLYLCRLQGLQDLVSKHRSHSDATLGEMKLAASNNASSLEEALNLAVREADSVLSELQMCLSDQQGEIADYAHQAREKACASINLITTISETTMSFFENLAKETSMLQDQLEQHYNTKDKDLSDFQRAYEEQAKEEDEKLISDISNLVAKAMGRKADLVNSRISSLREAAVQRKDSLQHSVSNIETATSDAKRKWETFSKQFEDDANSNAALSAAKHCRMELLLQKCGNVTNTVSQQLKSVKTTIASIGRNHEENMGLLSRDGMDANDKHCLELDLARASAEAAAESNTDDILLQVQTYLEHDHERVSQIHSTISAHSSTLNKFQNDHRDRVNNIEEDAKSCLHDNYLEYQPTSTTPTKMVIELPSKDQIDSMRAPAFDVIIEEFRKNNSHDPGLKLLPENGVFKDLKQFHDASIGKDSRMPLSEVNFS